MSKQHGLPVHCGDGKRREFFRTQHCFSNTPFTQFDRLAIIMEWLIEEHSMEWCSKYGEPGYSDPEAGVLFANWNNIPKAFADYLEAQGYELEWSDEWTIDYDNSKAYRTSPSSYDWEPSVVYTEDCGMLTPDDGAAEIIDAVSMTDWNQPAGCVPSWITWNDLQEAGYERHPDLEAHDFESGWFPGQNDDPAAIAKVIWNAPGRRVERIVFRKTEQSQFYCKFECWVLYEFEEESAA